MLAAGWNWLGCGCIVFASGVDFVGNARREDRCSVALEIDARRVQIIELISCGAARPEWLELMTHWGVSPEAQAAQFPATSVRPEDIAARIALGRLAVGATGT